MPVSPEPTTRTGLEQQLQHHTSIIRSILSCSCCLSSRGPESRFDLLPERARNWRSLRSTCAPLHGKTLYTLNNCILSIACHDDLTPRPPNNNCNNKHDLVSQRAHCVSNRMLLFHKGQLRITCCHCSHHSQCSG